MQRINRILISLATGLLVVSCGTGTSQTAGIDRGGITSGPVTGYGSIWVNGERYKTDAVEEIKVNGQDATEGDLKIGQVVVLDSVISGSGSNETRSAKRIVYESSLKGPVESVDVTLGTFVALGQQVMVDAGTTFGVEVVPADLTGLAVGNIVEVSGFLENPDLITGKRLIRATRVEKENGPGYELQLSGIVSDAVPTVSFRINGQLVVYNHPAYLGDGGQPFPGGRQPADGDSVRVIVLEAVDPKFGTSGEILASVVAYRGAPAAIEEGEDGDIEGLITDFVNQFSFRLAGFAVMTNAQTEYPDGGSAADLADNIRIEVEGFFDATGTLIAEEIEFREEGEALIEATVDAEGVTPISNSSGQTTYVVPVFGITVETTLLTIVEDKRDETRPFSPGNLEPGNFLKIQGTWDGSKLIATKLERIEGEDTFKLRGLISAARSPAFTLLGKGVLTAASTRFQVGDAEGQTSLDFFNAVYTCLPTGCIAEASWAAAGAMFIADEVALED